MSGFAHPLLGWDHVVAMLAVGLWGAFLGAPALWLLPVVFPLVMAAGGALGVLGVPLLAVEIGIAVSAIALGGVVGRPTAPAAVGGCAAGGAVRHLPRPRASAPSCRRLRALLAYASASSLPPGCCT